MVMAARIFLPFAASLFGAGLAAGVRLPAVIAVTVAALTVAAMTEKMKGGEPARRGKPYPIILKPFHGLSPVSDRTANTIAAAG